MANWASTAPHNRAAALSRGLPPDLMRLTEDHGVCISSCLDFWDDDLVLQGFNRCLILAPQTYGNPWFLRDDEYARFARINNLHRRWRGIMVNGMHLPEAYGPSAVSRGDESTRLITLRNLTWLPKQYAVRLDKTIGLAGRGGKIELRRLHPTEKVLGRFAPGSEVKVEVLPFRACLLLATSKPAGELGVEGCEYHVVRDVPGRPVVIKLLGMPGTEATVKLVPTDRRFAKATLNGKAAGGLLRGRAVAVTFGGKKLKRPWHRKLGELKPTAVPADAEALYETSCFAADNNALEYRAVERSGPTRVPQVRAARDVFFAQQLLRERGCWDRFMFDGDAATYYGGNPRGRAIRGGALRLDFGKPLRLSKLAIAGTYDDSGIWSIVAPHYLIDRNGKPGGLTGEYFAGSKFEGEPAVTRMDRRIDFRWRRDPARGVAVRDFCARWTGKIRPARSGTYRFLTPNNRGARLWVDGRQIIGNVSGRGAEGGGGLIELKAGKACDIKLEHIRRRGGTRVQLGWALEAARAAQVSADLARWQTVPSEKAEDGMTVDLSAAGAVRYFRMPGLFANVREVTGQLRGGAAAKRDGWRGSNLFASYPSAPAARAWQCSFELEEAPRGAYLCIAVSGRHGQELAYAALRVAGKPVGCPSRAPSYLVNPWEYPVRSPAQHVTYYAPVTADMIGKPIDAVVLGLDGCGADLTPAVWATCYPQPHESMELVLEPK
jgi:hypothetical protein